jgi:taurine--2-oxoglutarate transaminase
VAISRRIAETFHERPYPGGLTYSGHPLACASAVASIKVFEEEGTLAHVRRLGDEVVGPLLRDIAERHPVVGEVRGLGLFWAVELVRNRSTREMLVPFNASGAAAAPMAQLLGECKRRGMWPFVHFNRIQLAPPLVIGDAELKEGIAVLDEVLAIADAHVEG